MDKSGVLGDIGGQLGGLGKQIGSSVVKTPVDLTKTVKKQVGLVPERTNEDLSSSTSAKPSVDKNNEEIVKSLYAKSDANPQKQPVSGQSNSVEQPKTQEEAQEMQKVRQQLNEQHKTTYYDPTFNPQKQEEERPAEKVEREENEKKMDLMEENKKKQEDEDSLAAVRARNRVEKNPGSSG